MQIEPDDNGDIPEKFRNYHCEISIHERMNSYWESLFCAVISLRIKTNYNFY